MRCHKAQTRHTGVADNLAQERREIDVLILVAVDILPQQRHLDHTLIDHLLHTLDYVRRGVGAFPSPHVRHDAVGAIIVTTARDRQETGKRRLLDRHDAIHVFMPEGGHDLPCALPAPPGHRAARTGGRCRGHSQHTAPCASVLHQGAGPYSRPRPPANAVCAA